MARASQRHAVTLMVLQAVAVPLAATPGRPTPDGGSPLTIVVELIVEDAKGRPIIDLKERELEVFQEQTPQRAALEAQPQPGRYEITYVPRSGQSAPVSVRVLRPGARVRGPSGGFLTPRVIPALSPLEAEMAGLLSARPDAQDVPCYVSVLLFEDRTDGVHHTLAVEIPLSGLRFEQRSSKLFGRVQLFARIVGPDRRTVQRYSLDRPLEALSANHVAAQRLVWTGHVHLAPGLYALETVVRDPAAARLGVRTVSFTAPPTRGGLRLSSVALLQPRGALLAHEEQPLQDDPLYFHQEPLMPTLDLALPAGVETTVRFFVVVYADAARREPVDLTAELHRDGATVGQTRIPLPPPNAQGQIQYVGGMPTQRFPVGSYVLRLVARQGDAEVFEEASFRIVTEADAPRLRFTDR